MDLKIIVIVGKVSNTQKMLENLQMCNTWRIFLEKSGSLTAQLFFLDPLINMICSHYSENRHRLYGMNYMLYYHLISYRCCLTGGLLYSGLQAIVTEEFYNYKITMNWESSFCSSHHNANNLLKLWFPRL